MSRRALIREADDEDPLPFPTMSDDDKDSGEYEEAPFESVPDDGEGSGFGSVVDGKPRRSTRKNSPSTPTADAGSVRKANPDGVPDSFTLVGFIDDPEGAQDDPRYQVSEAYDQSLDYRGDELQYNVWVDKAHVRSQADFKDKNKPYVVFQVKKDKFDAKNPPFSKKRDFNFAGLVIFNNGGTAGRKPFSNIPDMQATYDELYRALSMPNNWGTGNLNGLGPEATPSQPPAASTPPPAAPPVPPAAPAAVGSGPVVEPAPAAPDAAPAPASSAAAPSDSPAAGSQMRNQKEKCCHTDRILDYGCFVKLFKSFTNIETDLTFFRRGIKKGKNGLNVHYIYDKTTRGNYILVSTAANTLLNLDSGDNIQKIVINIGSRGQAFSAKRDSTEFEGVKDMLRKRINDVRVFLPANDPCFISDDEIRSKNLVNLRSSLSETDIRRQIRNLLLNL